MTRSFYIKCIHSSIECFVATLRGIFMKKLLLTTVFCVFMSDVGFAQSGTAVDEGQEDGDRYTIIDGRRGGDVPTDSTSTVRWPMYTLSQLCPTGYRWNIQRRACDPSTTTTPTAPSGGVTTPVVPTGAEVTDPVTPAPVSPSTGGVTTPESAPVDASTVITNGTFTFSEFTCYTTPSTGTASGHCSTERVSPNGSGGIDTTGIIHTSMNEESSGPASADILISNRVTSTVPFVRLDLSFDGTTTGSSSHVETVETIYDGSTSPAVLIGQIRVDATNPNASFTFPPGLTSIILTKDTAAFVFSAPGSAGLSVIRERLQ